MLVFSSRLFFFALLPALLAAGCSDEYTCEDAIDWPATVTVLMPVDVDPAKPAVAPVLEVLAVFKQTACVDRYDTLEIASAKVTDVDTGEKLLDLSMRFHSPEDAMFLPCEGRPAGGSNIADVVTEGVTNADLAPLCGRTDLALEVLIRRKGCADTDKATQVSTREMSVDCP